MSTIADTRRTRHRVAPVVAVLVGGCLSVSLSACAGIGPDDGEGVRGDSFTAVSAATSSSPTATWSDIPGAELGTPVPRTSSEAGPLAGTQSLDVLPEEDTRLNVTEVRAGSHGDFDRVVVELDGTGAPGWKIGTDARPTAEGSGLAIDHRGTMALVIDVRGIRVTGGEHPTPVRDVANGTVASVTAEPAFEGTQRIVVGLNDTDPAYTVNMLDSPTRIVVDISRRD